MRHLIFLTLFISGPLLAGTIQKWVDEDGNVHYGDAPPVSAKTESVRVQSAPSNPGKALPRLGGQEKDEGDGSGASSTAAGTDVPRDQAKIACDQAQEDLAVINRSSRIKLKTADGGERFLTTEEISERKTQAEADIKQFCK